MSTIGRISMTKFDATFEWKISNFLSVIKDSAKSNRIVSPRFSFSDCDWFLAAYLDSDKKWICLYLKLDSVTDCKTIVFNVNLKRVDGTDIHCGLHPSNSEKVFKKDQLAWGYEEVIEFETLKNDNALISSGTLNIECFMQECKPQKMERLMELIKLETLSLNFKDLYINKKKSDVTIKVTDQEFQAHKAVLVARSSVFAAMFDHNTEEEKSGVVTIEDCDPDSFHEFLHFLYTGKTEQLSFLNACHLYVTADKYDVQELKSFCASYMMEHLTESNVCDAFIFAEKYYDIPLMSAAQFFFNRNACHIVSTAEWETLLIDNYLLANKILKKMLELKSCSKCSKE